MAEKSFCRRIGFARDKSFCQRKRLMSQNQGNMNLIYQGIVLSSTKGKCGNSKKKIIHYKILLFCPDFIQYKFTHFHGTFQIKINEITEENSFVEPWKGGPGFPIKACFLL